MNNRSEKFRSLTFKQVTILCLSAVAALVCMVLLQLAGSRLVEQVYLAPERQEQRVNKAIGEFRTYVSENRLTSADANAFAAWNREHPYVQLNISGRNAVINTTANGAEVLVSNSVLSAHAGGSPSYTFVVTFSDGPYTVRISEHSENSFYNVVNIVSVIVAALLFLICAVCYDRHVVHNIQHLSRQVRQVSQGALDKPIHPRTHDEIGSLAQDVDAMRLSIIEKLQREEAAWQANSQLITAISHDVRTPLTALMGYLDILAEGELDEATRSAYLEVCRHNAGRLKELTDELFRFFLLFGQAQPEQHLEPFDAATLTEQLLAEAQAELEQQGFVLQVRWEGTPEGLLRVDIGHLRRILDNLLSNVVKYADPAGAVTICLSASPEQLRLAITNGVRPEAAQVESNKIGLRTCEKLLTAMGGAFRQSTDGAMFTAELELPLFSDAEGI